MTTHAVGDSAVRTETPILAFLAVDDLFGRYSYHVDTLNGADRRLLLLHGDNGSGKTTILRLIYNLLSPADNRGHRTYLAATPFKRLSLTFTDGLHLEVEKQELLGSFDLRATLPNAPEVLEARYEADENHRIGPDTPGGLVWRVERDVYEQAALWAERDDLSRNARRMLAHFGQEQAKHELSREHFLKFLDERGTNPLFLADDRSLYSDDPELDRIRERFTALAEERKRPGRYSSDLVARELHVTLRRVNDWIRTLTLRGQTSGSAGANSIYHNVLSQMATMGTQVGESDKHASPDVTLDLLKSLGRESPRFEEYGLVPHFAADEFEALLSRMHASSRSLAYEILMPYLGSLRARYDALEEAEHLLRDLISILNEFLTDKQFTFNPRDGLTILTEDGAMLDPASLSSGERQLAMLLCTTVLAGRDSRLFIIDEPELSLGVGWQREILDALLALTRGTNLQFIVATHSIEILSGHADSLVRLVRR